MELHPLPCRTLVAHASADGFAEGTVSILSRLGYEILSPERFEKRRREGDDGDAGHRPDLLLVEESRLREVPDSGPDRRVPIVLLSRAGAGRDADPRVVAAVKPPVGMHDLYRVLQQVLEDRPRTTLRVRTRLPAVCRRSGSEWNAEVVSLSENGCLLHSAEPVPLGTALQLAFELPGAGTVHVRAETAYQLLPHLGLVFSSISPRIRQAIARYVVEALSEDPAGRPPTG